MCDARFKVVDETKILGTHWTYFSVNVIFIFNFTL